MEAKKILDLIAFFNDISIEETDVTSEEERANGQLVVVVTYHYKEQSFTTQRLYYRDVETADEVKDARHLRQHFVSPVYWLDIEKHRWPQPSGKSDLNHLVIDQIAQPGDDAFKEFLLLLGNNGKIGKIQQFTRDGERGQYHHNLMNNNHWHDLVTMIKAYIDSGGKDIDEKYFSRLIFMWQDGERATLSRFIGDRKIMDMLQENIQKVQPQLMNKEITDLLLQKKQIILQGPPGTGKTRAAEILAKEVLLQSLRGVIDDEYIRTHIPIGFQLNSPDNYNTFEIIRNDNSQVKVKPKDALNEYGVSYADIKSCCLEWNDDRLVSDFNTKGNGSYLVGITKYLLEKVTEPYIHLVQFHPAYGYEDFVRGITAESTGEKVAYKTENRLLGQLAKEAWDNYQDSKKKPEDLSKEQWAVANVDTIKELIQKEVGLNNKYPLTENIYIYQIEDDAFRYKGDNWDTPSRINIDDLIKIAAHNAGKPEAELAFPKEVSTHAHYRATYYGAVLKKMIEKGTEYKASTTIQQPLRNYVLVIDEINRANLPAVLGELIYALEYRGKKVDSMYKLDNGTTELIIPPNLYIIGTMNTADRSVGHIDYAIRRRFAFVDVGVDYAPIHRVGTYQATGLFKAVAKLFWKEFKEDGSPMERSPYLASDFQPEDVMIGHSYFLEKEATKLKIRLKYEIKPLLREYVKDGILNNDATNVIESLNV